MRKENNIDNEICPSCFSRKIQRSVDAILLERKLRGKWKVIDINYHQLEGARCMCLICEDTWVREEE